jgi:hypothetical protein
MITPISNAHVQDVEQVQQAPKLDHAQAQTQKSGAVSQDQVTLKSANQVDHDSGNK